MHNQLRAFDAYIVSGGFNDIPKTPIRRRAVSLPESPWSSMRKFVRKSLYVVLGAALLVTVYGIVLSIDREYQRKTDLGAGVTLIETVHIFRSAFTVIADSGGPPGFPYHIAVKA